MERIMINNYMSEIRSLYNMLDSKPLRSETINPSIGAIRVYVTYLDIRVFYYSDLYREMLSINYSSPSEKDLQWLNAIKDDLGNLLNDLESYDTLTKEIINEENKKRFMQGALPRE